jgi:heavy metal translocating P-type ATPase
MKPTTLCDLCGLPLRFGTFTTHAAGRAYRFCCNGCKQVFQMLFEATDAGNPEAFKETELFARCREMGLIPGSAAELDRKSSENRSPDGFYPSKDEASFEIGLSSVDHLNFNLKISGMWCPTCAWVIEAALKNAPGILTACCNFATDRVSCEYDPLKMSPDRIETILNRLGYTAEVSGESERSRENRKEFIRFSVSAFLTMNVMMLSFSLYFGFFSHLSSEAIFKISWPIFIMASVVMFYGGKPIYQKAFIGLTQAAFGMEALITIGAFSAYLYSIYNLFIHSIHLYFDTSSMLITLVLLGKRLEQKAKVSVYRQLEDFFSLKPTKVRICSDDYPEGRFVDAAYLKKGDVFSVKSEEIIPADGFILEGSGAVEESSVTGEARPIQKGYGHRIKSGTRMLKGAFKVKAERVGGDSTIGQMIQIMEKTLGQKMPLEGQTDRILKWFVPAILMLSLVVGITGLAAGLELQKAIIRSVTVMVIACPCALGIAIPIARVAGIAIAGKIGILVRNFSAFEQIEAVKAMVFDKTGTLTRGNWELREIRAVAPFTEKEALPLAAALEKNSEHYIGSEIMRYIGKDPLPTVSLKTIHYHPNGVSGMLDADEIKIGSKKFIARSLKNPSFSNNADTNHDALESTVYMSWGGQLCARFIFGDRLRPGAAKTVEQLEGMGYQMAIVSGDSERTTGAVGHLLGIKKAYGSQMPQDKAAFVKIWQQDGNKVAMVGDGINDAPALVQADLAIAVHSGNHLGREAADITLMQGKPEQILDFVNLAKQVNRTIRQNLFFSFGYNFISIPLAISGFLTPLVAVSAMVMSSISVIGNAVLLIKKNRRN